MVARRSLVLGQLGVVIAGAITVLTTAPKAAHGPAHPAPAK